VRSRKHFGPIRNWTEPQASDGELRQIIGSDQAQQLDGQLHSASGCNPKITAAQGIENALKILEGRWKLVILFHLFGGKVLRFSDLERAIPAISQKMLIQQLRRMEADGIVQRTLYPQVPPKVEYRLTPWGQKLCRRLMPC